MLSFLRIRNLAIVKDLSLEWGPGLNLLTGETGAGKSIVVEALGLVLGDRASAELLRGGEERAEIEAIFRLTEEESREARGLLAEAGIEPEGEEIIVRREIGEASRSRQYICDTPVSLTMLRKLGDLLVEIQGQHEHHALLNADAQREALDRFADLTAERERTRDLARAANEAASTLGALEERVRDRSTQLDYLRFQVQELADLGPSPADEESLRAERLRLQHASRRRELAESVYRALYEEEPSILGGLARAASDLGRLAEIDPEAARPLELAEQARRDLEEAVLEIRDYRERAEPDPGRLEAVEERLAEYDRLARKHKTTGAELAAALSRMRAEAEGLEGAEERIEVARAERLRLREEYLRAARTLSERRRAGGVKLAAALRRELAGLAMSRCEVAVEVRAEERDEEAALREAGLDRVEVRLSPNPGEPPQPLAEIVSGGELSRVMLAVNGVLGRLRHRRTLIFDEVDAGIGGRVAAIVGQKLRTLSGSHQVIVVTHLPQIASLADRHFLVEKRVEKGRTVALVLPLDDESRVAEIARMMAGSEISPLARRHAADMLRRSAPRPERRSP